MDNNNINMFLMTCGKFFEPHQLNVIKERLANQDDSTVMSVMAGEFKDPTTVLIVSIVAGSIGIDRFMIGDTGLGIAKLLTCGGFGLWTIIDWFMIQSATKEKNLEKLNMILR